MSLPLQYISLLFSIVCYTNQEQAGGLKLNRPDNCSAYLLYSSTRSQDQVAQASSPYKNEMPQFTVHYPWQYWYHLPKKNGQNNSANGLNKEFPRLTDSIRSQHRSLAFNEIQEPYDNGQLTNEINQLRIKHRKRENIILLVSIILLCGSFLPSVPSPQEAYSQRASPAKNAR